jgi:hypothetical protein
MRRLLGSMIAVVLLGACAGQSELSGDRRNVGSVTMTFTAKPARIEVGRPVVLTLRLTNNAGRAETIGFRGGERRYDFWITEGNDEIWRWSEEEGLGAPNGANTIGPQSSLTFSESWDADRPGTFAVFGMVLADGFDRPLEGEVLVGE